MSFANANLMAFVTTSEKSNVLIVLSYIPIKKGCSTNPVGESI